MKNKLTKKQKGEINALATMSDADINTSDIPPLEDDFWKNAVRNPFYRPKKESTTIIISTTIC